MPTRDDAGPDHEELLLLWAARRTGVLDALTTTAGTGDDVADETGLDLSTSARFVSALADYGYLRRVGDEYEVTNRALGFLATRDVRSIGATPRALDVCDAMAAVGDGSRATPTTADGDADAASRVSNETGRRHRLGAHASTPRETVRAGVTAAVHAAPDGERVVDVYGASGVYAAEFARRGYDATLVDTPAVVDAVGPMLAGRGVETATTSGPTVPSDDADLALLADVLQRRSASENRALLGSVHDALVPGGVVVVLEPLRGSPLARRVAVERLALGRGDAYDREMVASWLRSAGFVDPDVSDVPGTERQAVVGRCERGVD